MFHVKHYQVFMKDNFNNYKDIINTSYPIIDEFPKMPLIQRAKIFLPFSALTGFEEAIEKKIFQQELIIYQNDSSPIFHVKH